MSNSISKIINTIAVKRFRAVTSKNSKIAISEMFTTELKFAADCLLRWFNKKFKSNNLELSNNVKRKYEIEDRIDWSQNRCCICTFPLEINPTLCDADLETISYADFIIFKEHKFLRNICSNEELAKTDNMKDVKTYHKNFVRFLKIVVFFYKMFLILEMNLMSVSMTIYLIFVKIIVLILASSKK